jgi:hypothetical protein
MKRIPDFKSVDEELDYWSKHSMLEFMDVGEEVQLDFSEARKEREARRKRAGALRRDLQICGAQTFWSGSPKPLERHEVYGSVAPELVTGTEIPEENRPWMWISHLSATTPSPATS